MILMSIIISAHEENPPVAVVGKFVHLLEQGEQDLKEELGKFVVGRCSKLL